MMLSKVLDASMAKKAFNKDVNPRGTKVVIKIAWDTSTIHRLPSKTE